MHYAVFSPNGRRIVAISSSGEALLWNARTGIEVAVLGGHEHAIYDVMFSPNSTRIITSSYREAMLWNARTGKVVAVLGGHVSHTRCAAFSPDSRQVITTDYDLTVRVWDASDGSLIGVLQGHARLFEEGNRVFAAFNPRGTEIITAATDRTALLWDARTGECLDCVMLDASITAFDVCGDAIVLGDALGRVHSFNFPPARSKTTQVG